MARSLSRCHAIHVVVQVEQAALGDALTVRMVRCVRHKDVLNVRGRESCGGERIMFWNVQGNGDY